MLTAGTTPHARTTDASDARTARTDSLGVAIQRQLAAGVPDSALAADDWQRVQRLYAAQGHRALWTDTVAGPHPRRPRATALLDAVSGAPAHALDPSGYVERALRAALTEAERPSATADMLARADVLLTAAYVAFGTDLLVGQIDPRSVNREWHIDPQRVDVDSVLTAMLHHEPFAEALTLLRPQDPDYGRLMEALARYRQIVATGGWPQIPARGVLRPGDTTTAELLGLLMARLHTEGFSDLTPLAPAQPRAVNTTTARGPRRAAIYDSALAEAVALYQARHELGADRIVGPQTLASLNRPAEYRVARIAANLERHRWLPRLQGDRYVVVNVPAFRLRAYDAGQEVLAMNVVVGAEYGGRTTPVFSDSMSYVVFRPYWNVPEGIARRELWPKQREDQTFFARHGYETVQASWGTYVRQRPAADNALGRVKFIFPNDYAIYLHDTPAQALFAERVRAFSHGCIRVEHPDQLAEFVLAPQGWDIDRVRAAMVGAQDDRRVDLDRKLPVYIVYFTTFVREGVLHFGHDIYDRDAALVRAMRVPIRGAMLP